jgi:hypothetical protein
MSMTFLRRMHLVVSKTSGLEHIAQSIFTLFLLRMNYDHVHHNIWHKTNLNYLQVLVDLLHLTSSLQLNTKESTSLRIPIGSSVGSRQIPLQSDSSCFRCPCETSILKVLISFRNGNLSKRIGLQV